MTTLSWWKRSLMVMGGVAACLAAVVAHPGQGNSAEPPAQVKDADEALYRGSRSCVGCHNQKDNPAYSWGIGFVRLNEYQTWKDQDKHSLAFANLLGPRGKAMAGLLKIADPTVASAGCIGCHGALEGEAKKRHEGAVFDPNEGVSCENCHGPSSKWWLRHVDEAFRKSSTADRDKLGMIDLRQPVTQANQCLTCHIGNSDEGKVVTHDMYAAGHPPLPSIEVATFSDVIPRHWWLVAEKPIFQRKPAPDLAPGQKERTRLAIVGAAVALRTSMKLLADETKTPSESTVPGLEWPDYARFDCWSCHHDLKRESWRQARGFQAAPGRPPISEWPLAMVELGIDLLEIQDPAAATLRNELKEKRGAVLSDANARPYGRKVPLAKSAGDLVQWSNVLINRLASVTYTEDVAFQLLGKLLERGLDKVADYDEARHIAWAIKLLVEDSGKKIIDRSKIDPILAKFDAGLKLTLPAGRDYQIDDQLKKALEVIGDYEPADFRRHLEELKTVLPRS